MQLTALLSAAAFVASASAKVDLRPFTTEQLNADCNTKKAYAEIVNRCDYDVHLWSVFRGDGCPTDGGHMVTLKKGGVYRENLFASNETDVGISIKISKTEQCKGPDITQLEYYLEMRNLEMPFNFLDVSYVDCLGGDCPARKEGYYLVSGAQTGAVGANGRSDKSAADNTWCPILACHDTESCDKCSYVLPDDVQTKTCSQDQNMHFYMCGGEAPTEDYSSSPVQSSVAEHSAPAPIAEDEYKVKAAAVTPQPIAPKVKTEIVYVTAYEYVNAKRHAHGHARRHGNRA